MDAGSYVEDKMVGALRTLGADYVFDTTFAADLTIMEEASELIDRIVQKKPPPQFTSCCPAWVKFVETYYPSLLLNISTSKSPISMFAQKEKIAQKIAPEDLYVVALTPCTAKKFEITRDELHDAQNYHKTSEYLDCDMVITTKEFANYLRAENLDLAHVQDGAYDTLMPRGSGAGIIFGNSGGVMEAAIRSAYYFLTNQQPTNDLPELVAVHGLDGVIEASLTIADIPLKVAVIQGTDNARKFISHMEESKKHYDFVEVMTCRGGCIAGGGQPKHNIEQMDDIRKKRISSLYDKDASIELRNSHDNPTIKQIYDEFYTKPGSEVAHQLLHTTYHVRDDLHEDPSIYAQDFQNKATDEPKQETGIQYKCSICGYVYEGDITKEDDTYTCPLCNVPKEMFDKVEE